MHEIYFTTCKFVKHYAGGSVSVPLSTNMNIEENGIFVDCINNLRCRKHFPRDLSDRLSVTL